VENLRDATETKRRKRKAPMKKEGKTTGSLCLERRLRRKKEKKNTEGTLRLEGNIKKGYEDNHYNTAFGSSVEIGVWGAIKWNQKRKGVAESLSKT